ncbi:helix-turn-helix transcriptional regulator [Sphingomonas sp. PB4P5]|uniref:helix-turn-helix transcriptional regulator n=1 Tax=Parasphingomonas puruogangriensis TaxID=3096155 RepID=UPI002FC71DEF
MLAKIGAVLPDDLKDNIAASGLLIGPGEPIAAGDAELVAIRQAIRTERAMHIAYADERGSATERTVWPVALAFFDRTRVVVAWCEFRQGYRHFRTDRITALNVSSTRYPRRRAALLKEWHTLQGVPEQ